MFEKLVPELRPKYGIKPDGLLIGEIHRWAFDTLEEAKAGALELSRRHNVAVLVFRIVGAFHRETSWVDYE